MAAVQGELCELHGGCLNPMTRYVNSTTAYKDIIVHEVELEGGISTFWRTPGWEWLVWLTLNIVTFVQVLNK